MKIPTLIRLRCPICDAISPMCDQSVDVRRDVLHNWWKMHAENHRPTPIIESAEG